MSKGTHTGAQTEADVTCPWQEQLEHSLKKSLIISPGCCASFDLILCQPIASAEDFRCRGLARTTWHGEAGHPTKPSCLSQTLTVCCWVLRTSPETSISGKNNSNLHLLAPVFFFHLNGHRDCFIQTDEKVPLSLPSEEDNPFASPHTRQVAPFQCPAHSFPPNRLC